MSIAFTVAGLAGLAAVLLAQARSTELRSFWSSLVALGIFIATNLAFAVTPHPRQWMSQVQAIMLLLIGIVSAALSRTGEFGGTLLVCIAVVLLARYQLFTAKRQVGVVGLAAVVIIVGLTAIIRSAPLQELIALSAITSGVFAVVFIAFYGDFQSISAENIELRRRANSREELLEKLRNQLQDAESQKADAQRTIDTLSQRSNALQEQIGELETQRADPAFFRLTDRETEALRILVETAAHNREIAKQMGVTEHTVKSHFYSICNKVGVDSRVELIELFRFSFTGSGSNGAKLPES